MDVATANTVVRDEQSLSKRIVRGFRAAIDAFVRKRIQDAVSLARAGQPRTSQHRKGDARAPDHTETPCVKLRPLGEDIISSAIPAFFIGRNKSGFWVARETNGRIGGIFFLKGSALAFARSQDGCVQCAFVFPSETFELDLENDGNPFAQFAESLLRVGTGLRHRILAASLVLAGLAGIIALQAAVYLYLWRLPL